MRHAELLDLVRQHVRSTFQTEGVENVDDCCETILVRDGFYCGRRFVCDSLRAIWFLEEQVIKFYGSEGKFLYSRATTDLHPSDHAAA